MKKADRFLRLKQIIGQPEVTPEKAVANRKAGKSPRKPQKEIQPIIPISSSSWWAGVKSGRYPKPVKLSRGVTAWRESEVLAISDDQEVA